MWAEQNKTHNNIFLSDICFVDSMNRESESERERKKKESGSRQFSKVGLLTHGRDLGHSLQAALRIFLA